MNLAEAHTRKMNQLESRMSDHVARCGGFAQMNEQQEVFHNKMASEWDLLKADRETAKLVDRGEMSLKEFNDKKLSL